MNLDTIPVFKPFQALTANHLNDLREFLDHEDRLTRRALIGIGVMCGFELDLEASGSLRIAKGVAVTSEGYVIAEEAVVCDRFRPYQMPLPSGEDVPPEQVDEARYPFLFPDGETQIEAWEMLTTEVEVPANAPPPETLSAAFLADKTVMLFLECTEESLKNCDINDCSDKGAELQFALRRLLVRRADADAILLREAEIAGFPTDRASHPGLALKHLRVEDLGLARNGIATYPALFARILQIAARLSADLPKALREAWSAYRHLLVGMFPPDRFPEGPFPDDYFGNLWGNLAVQPFLAQYFYDYLLDAAMAYNDFVAKARAYEAECLPHPGRFPKHVLLGDPAPRPLGFVAEVSSPAEFDAYDPLAASTGFGPRPNPPRRRTPWTPADAGPALEELRALFHRLVLLAHAFQLRGLLNEEIRVTPSRHDDAPLGERCVPPYYAFNVQSDLFRVWSPRKTRANLLSTVYSHQFSKRDADHPYLYRIDGQTFHAVAGHVGKDLARVMGELIEHKRVLGLDFAIEPVWMGLALAGDLDGLQVDEATRRRALEAVTRLVICRMGDFEVVLLTLLAALFAFLVYILRGIGRQRTEFHANVPRTLAAAPAAEEPTAPEAARPELAAADITRLSALARRDALRRPETLSFSALRLRPDDRREIRQASKELLDRFRKTPPKKGEATETLAGDAGEEAIGAFYLAVKDDADGGTLFDRVRDRVAELNLEADRPGATDRIYNAVAAVDAAEELMARASVSSLEDFDALAFETAYVDFSDKMATYVQTAPADPEDADQETASTNLAIADYAPVIAAQTTTFSSAGLLGEAQRRIEAIFADLTLAGAARRHPGLEHRAGVPEGGTLFLYYCSKLELLALMQRAAPELDRLSGELKLSLPPGGLTATIARAAEEVLAAAGPRGEDALSDFVVLGDFCLDSKCCDSDCSDIVLRDRSPETLFDLGGSGRMAVDPVIPNGRPAGASLASAPVGGDGLRALLRGIGVGGLAADPGGQPGGVRPAPGGSAGPVPGLLAGRVTGTGGASSTVVPGSVVLAVKEDTAETTRIETRDGVFVAKLAPGRYQLQAEAEGFEAAPRSVTIEPGGELRLDLRMRRRR